MDTTELETRIHALELVVQRLAVEVFRRASDPVGAADAFVEDTKSFTQALVGMSFEKGNDEQRIRMISLSSTVEEIIEHIADDVSADCS